MLLPTRNLSLHDVLMTRDSENSLYSKLRFLKFQNFLCLKSSLRNFYIEFLDIEFLDMRTA
jgi:hypothetical protein